MIIDIKPVPAYPSEATQIRVDDGHVRLEHGANFQAMLLDAGGAVASNPTRVPLTDEQYANWTGDDTYVAQCVAHNMGLEAPDGVTWNIPADPVVVQEPDPVGAVNQ